MSYLHELRPPDGERVVVVVGNPTASPQFAPAQPGRKPQPTAFSVQGLTDYTALALQRALELQREGRLERVDLWLDDGALMPFRVDPKTGEHFTGISSQEAESRGLVTVQIERAQLMEPKGLEGRRIAGRKLKGIAAMPGVADLHRDIRLPIQELCEQVGFDPALIAIVMERTVTNWVGSVANTRGSRCDFELDVDGRPKISCGVPVKVEEGVMEEKVYSSDEVKHEEVEHATSLEEGEDSRKKKPKKGLSCPHVMAGYMLTSACFELDPLRHTRILRETSLVDARNAGAALGRVRVFWGRVMFREREGRPPLTAARPCDVDPRSTLIYLSGEDSAEYGDLVEAMDIVIPGFWEVNASGLFTTVHRTFGERVLHAKISES